MQDESESETIEVEVDAELAGQVTDRLRLVERAGERSADEVAGRYLRYGMLHHEEAIFD